MMESTLPFTAVILVGGRGTRLRSVVSDVPKPLAPVAGEPFLNHLLRDLARQGVRRVILATGHSADFFKTYTREPARFGLDCIEISREPESLLGTGGALGLMRERLRGTGRFLLLNGDTFFESDLRPLWQRPWDPGVKGYLGLCEVPDRARFGSIEFDSNGFVCELAEKTKTGAGWVNAGIALYHESVLDLIPDGVVFSLEKELLPDLIHRRTLGAIPLRGQFFDIGLPESYFRFHLDLVLGRVQRELGSSAVQWVLTWLRQGRVYHPAERSFPSLWRGLFESRAFVRPYTSFGEVPLSLLGPDDLVWSQDGESFATAAKVVSEGPDPRHEEKFAEILGLLAKIPRDFPLPSGKAGPVLYLDRDGVVIDYVPYIQDEKKVSLRPGIVPLIALAHQRGYRVVLVTNQSGLGREYYSPTSFWAIQRRCQELLAEAGQWLDAVYSSAYIQESRRAWALAEFSSRKPSPGALAMDARLFSPDLAKSMFVGDHRTDMECGRRFGVANLAFLDSARVVAADEAGYFPEAMSLARRFVDLIDVRAWLDKISQ